MAKGKLLVVDDEESVSLTIEAILEKDGYEVTAVTRGEAALDLLRSTTFDLVLTDLRLDDVDGLAILGELRRTSPDTVGITLTGYASLDSAIQALREGAYDYLVKPCDVEELRATIARGIERRNLGLEIKQRVADLEVANATIQSLNADLQRRVDEATAALQQRMAELARANQEIAELYRQAQGHVQRLRELDELKSRFLSMASHELKTPLTSILGMSQFLQRRVARTLDRRPISPEEWELEQRGVLERLGLIEGQAHKLARLVDELLDVSRIQSDRIELHMESVDVAKLARSVVGQMRLVSDKHTIELVDASEPLVAQADPHRLEQVFTNLLSNAIKYSPEGGPIVVRVGADDKRALVSVKDHGLGIPAEDLESIFNLFYHSSASERYQVGGMGLGLYISKEIVRRHGGSIWAESAPGKGSTFHVALPRQKVSVPR